MSANDGLFCTPDLFIGIKVGYNWEFSMMVAFAGRILNAFALIAPLDKKAKIVLSTATVIPL